GATQTLRRIRSTALPIDDLGIVSEEITHLAFEQGESEFTEPVLLLEVLAHHGRRDLSLVVAVGDRDSAQFGFDVGFGDEQLLLAGGGLAGAEKTPAEARAH